MLAVDVPHSHNVRARWQSVHCASARCKEDVHAVRHGMAQRTHSSPEHPCALVELDKFDNAAAGVIENWLSIRACKEHPFNHFVTEEQEGSECLREVSRG